MPALEDFKTNSGWGMRYAGTDHKTKAYSLWHNMKQRCYNPVTLRRDPCYSGCTLSENFLKFQFFAEWCQTQIGYKQYGYQIDKDILVQGNKLYSEHTCAFVPSALNKFLLANNAARGAYPQGVDEQSGGKFRARISVDGTLKHLGYFATPELAFEAYKVAKETEALRWHTRLKAGEFLVDERVILALQNWKLKE